MARIYDLYRIYDLDISALGPSGRVDRPVPVESHLFLKVFLLQTLTITLPALLLVTGTHRFLSFLCDFADVPSAEQRILSKIRQLQMKLNLPLSPYAQTRPTSRDELQEFDPDSKRTWSGGKVRHPKYGEGQILSVQGGGIREKVIVRFQSHGIKEFVSKYCQLEYLSRN